MLLTLLAPVPDTKDNSLVCFGPKGVPTTKADRPEGTLARVGHARLASNAAAATPPTRYQMILVFMASSSHVDPDIQVGGFRPVFFYSGRPADKTFEGVPNISRHKWQARV